MRRGNFKQRRRTAFYYESNLNSSPTRIAIITTRRPHLMTLFLLLLLLSRLSSANLFHVCDTSLSSLPPGKCKSENGFIKLEKYSWIRRRWWWWCLGLLLNTQVQSKHWFVLEDTSYSHNSPRLLFSVLCWKKCVFCLTAGAILKNIKPTEKSEKGKRNHHFL